MYHNAIVCVCGLDWTLNRDFRRFLVSNESLRLDFSPPLHHAVGYVLIRCSFFFVTDLAWARLLLFLAGKFAITISYTVMYVYNAELFPTQLRHSLLGACVMFGQIGSILAPQTPLLVRETWFDGFIKHQHFQAQW